MRKIFLYLLMINFIPVQAIQSPLHSFNDYIFTEPVNTNFIQGSILGPNPPSYGPVRGEDSIYLYEAYSEMYSIISSSPSTVRTRAPGIDTAYMQISYPPRTGRPAYQDIYYLFLDNTNGARNVITKNVTVSMPTNVIPLPNYYTYPYYMAGNAAVYSGAAMTAAESLKPLAISPRVRYLAVTNVAAYYEELKKVAGIAKDFEIESDTNRTDYTVYYEIQDCAFSEGTFTYNTVYTESLSFAIGGGLSDFSVQSSGRTRKLYNGNYYLSDTLHTSGSGNYIANNQVEAPLFMASVVSATQLTPRKAWVVSLATYQRTLQRWTSPTNTSMTVNIYTNFICVIESQVSISEKNGAVKATLYPDYDDSYRAFFAANPSFPYPDNIVYPTPPSPSYFAADETGEKWNVLETRITIKPVKVALVLDVDWHTGFNRIGANK